MAQRRIMVATPAYDGKVEVLYAHSLLETIQLLAPQGIHTAPIWWPYESLVQRARNELLRIAVESGVDDLLFIDADQSWNPSYVARLLNHPVDVVGAPVRKKTDDSEQYNVHHGSTNIEVDPITGLWRVDGLGTGFLRLSKKAMTDLWNSSVEYQDGDHLCRMVFEVGILDGKIAGEDIFLCRKLTRLGYTIHLDPTFTVDHIGVKTFKGDFQKWVERTRIPDAQPCDT